MPSKYNYKYTMDRDVPAILYASVSKYTLALRCRRNNDRREEMGIGYNHHSSPYAYLPIRAIIPSFHRTIIDRYLFRPITQIPNKIEFLIDRFCFMTIKVLTNVDLLIHDVCWGNRALETRGANVEAWDAEV